MTKNRIRNQLPTNLPQLQNLTKRDPHSYKDEFLQQLRHFTSLLQVHTLSPEGNHQELQAVAMFLAQVSSCYPPEVKNLPEQIMEVLKRHRNQLHKDIRMTFCRALILMRNKGLISPLPLLELFFLLLQCQDKALRKYLFSFIVTDIKNVNSKHRNHKLNSGLQNFMFGMLKDSHPVSCKLALDAMIELYRKNIWNDTKTVTIIATACFSKHAKIMVSALKFFLGTNIEKDEDDTDDEDTDDEKEVPSMREATLSHNVNKKTRKRKKQLASVKRQVKKSRSSKKAENFNFSALHLINDPQELSEKLYKKLETMNERYEVKVLLLEFLSRLIGIHELLILNYYPYIARLLQPHQREVVKILQCAAQASHPLVPPDSLEPVLRGIANNFITERNSEDVMAVGLNSVREICVRCPLAIDDDLLHDLTTYKTHKDKGVGIAARSLIQLYRNVDPTRLQRKHRGAPTEARKDLEILQYGETSKRDYIPASDVVHGDIAANLEEDDEEQGVEINSDDESADDDDMWVDVQHSEDEGDSSKPQTECEQAVSIEEKRSQSRKVIETRFLTQDEFIKIDQEQIERRALKAKSSKHIEKSQKRAEALLGTERGELVKLRNIETVYTKKQRENKTKGEDEKEKHGSKKGQHNEQKSETNTIKQKRKNYMMLKPKLNRKKTKKSFQERQIALRNALVRAKKYY